MVAPCSDLNLALLGMSLTQGLKLGVYEPEHLVIRNQVRLTGVGSGGWAGSVSLFVYGKAES